MLNYLFDRITIFIFYKVSSVLEFLLLIRGINKEEKMRKVNNQIRSGMALIIAVILMGLVLQGFFQSWINEQNVESKILLAVPLVVSCIIGCYLMIKGSFTESMAKK